MNWILKANDRSSKVYKIITQVTGFTSKAV